MAIKNAILEAKENKRIVWEHASLAASLAAEILEGLEEGATLTEEEISDREEQFFFSADQLQSGVAKLRACIERGLDERHRQNR